LTRDFWAVFEEIFYNSMINNGLYGKPKDKRTGRDGCSGKWVNLIVDRCVSAAWVKMRFDGLVLVAVRFGGRLWLA